MFFHQLLRVYLFPGAAQCEYFVLECGTLELFFFAAWQIRVLNFEASVGFSDAVGLHLYFLGGCLAGGDLL